MVVETQSKNGKQQRINGKKAEEYFAELLCNIDFIMLFNLHFNIKEKLPETSCMVLSGNTKTDVMWCDIGFQVKSYRIPQKHPQQIHKSTLHCFLQWCGLNKDNEINDILQRFIEIPLIEENGKKIVNKSLVKSSLLLPENYTIEELEYITRVLNRKKQNILKVVFGGNPLDKKNTKPTYFCCLCYEKIENSPNKISIFNIFSVMKFLSQFDFTITEDGKTISLGDILYLRRKGGDCGKPSSNQLQIVMNTEKLINLLCKAKCGFFNVLE
jgi:hypothetical protein